jgi:hypothetical protein
MKESVFVITAKENFDFSHFKKIFENDKKISVLEEYDFEIETDRWKNNKKIFYTTNRILIRLWNCKEEDFNLFKEKLNHLENMYEKDLLELRQYK